MVVVPQHLRRYLGGAACTQRGLSWQRADLHIPWPSDGHVFCDLGVGITWPEDWRSQLCADSWAWLPYFRQTTFWYDYMMWLPWKLTYFDIPRQFLKMIFLFPRWDMLVPWRVYASVLVMCLEQCYTFRVCDECPNITKKHVDETCIRMSPFKIA